MATSDDNKKMKLCGWDRAKDVMRNGAFNGCWNDAKSGTSAYITCAGGGGGGVLQQVVNWPE